MREIRSLNNSQPVARIEVGELPHSVEAEQQLLGGLLIDNELAAKVGFLKAEHFFDPVHMNIFGTIIERIDGGRLASPVTLKQDLESDPGLNELGGGRYLARLAGASVSAFALLDYAMMIVELSRRRKVIEVCRTAIEDIKMDGSADNAVSSMEMFVSGQEPAGQPRTTSLLGAHTEAIREVLEIRDGNSPAIPSGLKSLDEVLSLRRGRYTMLAGATSMGKTAVAQWITYSAARAGFGVAFASLEMPERDLAARLNSIDSRVPYKAFERPMSENVLRKVVEAAKGQEALPIEIFKTNINDLPSIITEAKKLKQKWPANEKFRGLGLLVIDYIQLVKGEGRDFEVLSTVANNLKQLAKLLDVHVIALAQVDRKVVERENKRPGLSDLRGSGDLEMAPDNVVFCHREEYYMERMPRPKKTDELVDFEADLAACKGKMELIVAKVRMGELGTVEVGCDMGTNRLWDIEKTQDFEF